MAKTGSPRTQYLGLARQWLASKLPESLCDLVQVSRELAPSAVLGCWGNAEATGMAKTGSPRTQYLMWC
jgi:hypothetical protein